VSRIAHPVARRKELGAFYTPPAMAAKLVNWAVRDANDRVIDPSLGGFVFLKLAKERLLALGSSQEDLAGLIYGVDLDSEALHAARSVQGLEDVTLIHSDFFEVQPDHLPQFTANVGNPPYVRYQRWSARQSKAHTIAEAMGARLTRLSSLWAPFILHGCRFLQAGGRLAQVLPAELLHAQYARPVAEHLVRSFRKVTVAVFHERVFPGAMEEVLLLFAEGFGEGPAAGIGLVTAKNLDDLDVASLDGIGQGYLSRRLPMLGLLPRRAQALYRQLEQDPRITRLGELARVNIGAVTGGNDFFLRTRAEVDRRGFAPTLFKTAVSRAGDLPGAQLDHSDIVRLAERGRPTELLAVNGHSARELASIRELIEEGERRGLPERYKCRIRPRWWSVPLPTGGAPNGFLTYMSNTIPRLVYNKARAISTNTLHGVVVADGVSMTALVVAFYNSLTLLSAELVGRSYGGGILKLEPTEAQRLVIPPLAPGLGRVLVRVDRLLRAGEIDLLVETVDSIVLAPLGLCQTELAELRNARAELLARRKSRSKTGRA
jgi:adenine-specific DNA-methyltransferase